VINENIHEEDRMTAKTELLMYYTKVNGCMMWIPMWQNVRGWRVKDILCCVSAYYNVNFWW
jgi:hypothetical protein